MAEKSKQAAVQVFLDLGNLLLKGVVYNCFGHEVVMDHAVKVMTASEGDAMRKAQRRQSYRHSAEFEVRDTLVQVGEIAKGAGRKTNMQGDAKFTRGYYDLLALAMLTKLLPDGHDNIHLFLGHPSNATNYIENMQRAVGGSHSVRLSDGRTVKYRVTKTRTYDEPVGGLMRFMLGNLGRYNPHEINNGDRIVMIDIGGRVSSALRVIVNRDAAGRLAPEVIFDEDEETVFEDGIQKVLNRLPGALKNLAPEYFRVTTIPPEVLEEALRTKQIELPDSDEPLNVVDAVNAATGPLLDNILTKWETIFRRGLGVKHVLVTGGGGGLLFDDLQKDLKHKSMHKVEDDATMHLANVRGAYLSYQEELEQQGG